MRLHYTISYPSFDDVPAESTWRARPPERPSPCPRRKTPLKPRPARRTRHRRHQTRADAARAAGAVRGARVRVQVSDQCAAQPRPGRRPHRSEGGGGVESAQQPPEVSMLRNPKIAPLPLPTADSFVETAIGEWDSGALAGARARRCAPNAWLHGAICFDRAHRVPHTPPPPPPPPPMLPPPPPPHRLRLPARRRLHPVPGPPGRPPRARQGAPGGAVPELVPARRRRAALPRRHGRPGAFLGEVPVPRFADVETWLDGLHGCPALGGGLTIAHPSRHFSCPGPDRARCFVRFRSSQKNQFKTFKQVDGKGSWC